jgi:hypothetical protein
MAVVKVFSLLEYMLILDGESETSVRFTSEDMVLATHLFRTYTAENMVLAAALENMYCRTHGVSSTSL